VTRATPLRTFWDASAQIEVSPVDIDRGAFPCSASSEELTFRIHSGLTAAESEWRCFEQIADSTPFQHYDWLAAWYRHIGIRTHVTPAIVVGRFVDGRTAFIMPLAVEKRGLVRRLSWLGQDLSDYNAPLLARNFSERVNANRFLALWQDVRSAIQSDGQLRHDWIAFEKMPQTIGAQTNPFCALNVAPNANSAHLTRLGANWDAFYRAKRSSATRRRDRSKRRHMTEFGEIRFVNAADPSDARRTLETLMAQKSLSFARKGIPDIFARPGYRDFFLDFVSNPATRHLVHVSRIEIGPIVAAANFAVVNGDCYYHILASYCDGQLAHYGPGALHLRELLAYAIKRGLRRFDFTIGDERYKAEWCDLRLNLFDYCAAATWRGWPASALSMTRRRLKRFVKQTPLLWQIALRLRSAVVGRRR
jgi:CelD/BcsL family acetyltransferase involved in cellulose biosynthesis